MVLCGGLFLFVAVAAGTAVRIAAADVADVDFAEGAMRARAVKFAIGNAATDRRVHFTTFFVHHNFQSSFKKVKIVSVNFQKIIDNLQNLRYNSIEKIWKRDFPFLKSKEDK